MIHIKITSPCGTITEVSIPIIAQSTVNVSSAPSEPPAAATEPEPVEEAVAEVKAEEPTPAAPEPLELEDGDDLAAFAFPCRGNATYQAPKKLIADFIKTYGEEVVRREFLKARAWLLASPDRLKTQRGCGRFLNGWISRHNTFAAPVSSAAKPSIGISHLEAPNKGLLAVPCVEVEGRAW